MNIKTITAGAVLAITLTLTSACTSQVQSQQVPSETDAPVATATAEPTETAAPAETVLEIPADVQEHFGAYTSTLVASGEEIMALTKGGLADFYGPREGEEAMYYEPLRPYMDAAAYDRLLAYASGTATTADAQADSLVPQASRDGVWAPIDDVFYTVDPNRQGPGLVVTLDGEPTISLAKGDDGSVLGVFYTQPMTITAYGVPANLTYSANETLMLTPSAEGDWVINGWSEDMTSALAPVQS